MIILVAITLVNKNAENETLQHFACDQFKGICVFESFVTNEFSNSAVAAGSWRRLGEYYRVRRVPGVGSGQPSLH